MNSSRKLSGAVVTDRESLIILNMLSGIGPAKARDLISACGTPSDIFTKSKKDLISIPGIGESLAGEIFSWREKCDVEREFSLTDKAGVRIITILDEDYPEMLKEIFDPPLVLYVRGELPESSNKNIGIVGSRKVTNYGRKTAKHLAESATYANWIVVSGLAYGIDYIAHKGVVDAGGKTIAVLGGGLLRFHPQDHINLGKEIIDKGGAVISELPMEFSPTKWTFPMRNRIISGLSQGVIVVEAGLRSGSLITAKYALEQGRTVFAVPGEIDNHQAKGCNHLIKNGARLTENFDDVIEEFSFLPGMSLFTNKKPEFKEPEKKELSAEEEKIVNILKSGIASADSLCLHLNMSPPVLLPLLMQLELKRVVKQLPGKQFELKH